MTIGISKERLEELLRDLPRSDYRHDTIDYLLDRECTELNPWLPIEQAPKDKTVLMYSPEFGQITAQLVEVGIGGVTHYQELPADPK